MYSLRHAARRTHVTTLTASRALSSGAPPSLIVKGEDARASLMEEVRQQAYPDLVLTGRQLCDVELLLNGGFNPLDGFLNKKDTESVYDNYRLANGMLWPMPINLDVATETGKQLASGPQGSVALRDQEGNLIAVMDLNDAWEVDKEREAKAVFGGDPEHPAIRYLYNQAGDMYLGGQLRGYQLPPHYDYTSMRQTPAELRAQFDEMGWTGKPVVAFQTRNPMHRAHVELVKSAAEEHNANILIHPVVGMTKPGGELFMFLHLCFVTISKNIYKVFILHSITLFMDSFFSFFYYFKDVDYHTRIKCIRAVINNGDLEGSGAGGCTMSVLPLAMRMGGPREALWHMLIRKNYGATHFILGRDHAGPGSNSQGQDFYGPYDARDFGVKYVLLYIYYFI